MRDKAGGVDADAGLLHAQQDGDERQVDLLVDAPLAEGVNIFTQDAGRGCG